MSGIVSLLNGDGAPVEVSLLRRMTEFMAFRGPDAQASWHQGSIGLGHTLLRTTFESEREQQPLTLDQQVWIVADARLDGRSDLVQVLRAAGREVSQDVPDVELVLHAYQVWDMDCLDHLMGDFVFLIWDERQRRLFAARDQFGILPFYYAQVNGSLICSNTLNCIRLHPGVSATLNEQAVGDFLLFGMNMEFSTTIFTDIQRLPPAHHLVWSEGKLRVQRYWKLPRCLPLIRYKQPQDYVAHFDHLFRQAVSDRLRTDKIATHISGGMDSTSVAAVAQQVLAERGAPFNFQAFMMSSQQMPEEVDYAHQVAEKIGIPLNIMSSDQYRDVVPPFPPETLLPEPGFSIPARDPSRELMRCCAVHGRVALTGFGGDPALRFGEFYWLEWFKHGHFGQWLSVQQHSLSMFRRPVFSFRQGWRYWKAIASRPPFPAYFNSSFVKRLDLQTRWSQINVSSLSQISRYGMGNSPFWSNLFISGDSGYHTMPLKHYFPFFDVRLVSYLIAIPPVPWLTEKTILREAMQQQLPESVRSRPKKVLPPPQNYSQVMQEMLEEWIENLLENTSSLQEYINGFQVLSLLRSPEPLVVMNRALFERMLSFAYWLRSESLTVQSFVEVPVAIKNTI